MIIFNDRHRPFNIYFSEQQQVTFAQLSQLPIKVKRNVIKAGNPYQNVVHLPSATLTLFIFKT